MKDPVRHFAKQFRTSLDFDTKLTTYKKGKYFLLTEDLQKLQSKDFFFAGTYLGESTKSKFSPSFSLLRMIANHKANKITVDEKTEWLFICGRDIFRRGIIGKSSIKKGEYVLVMNRYNECLGFGRVLHNLNKQIEGVAVENILDIGDFLRRERQYQ
jgi:ribosome biogenesis protein Nip4